MQDLVQDLGGGQAAGSGTRFKRRQEAGSGHSLRGRQEAGYGT